MYLRLFDVDPIEREDNHSIFTLYRERPRSILNSGWNIYAHKASRPVSFWSCFQLIREMKAVREWKSRVAWNSRVRPGWSDMSKKKEGRPIERWECRVGCGTSICSLAFNIEIGQSCTDVTKCLNYSWAWRKGCNTGDGDGYGEEGMYNMSNRDDKYFYSMCAKIMIYPWLIYKLLHYRYFLQ